MRIENDIKLDFGDVLIRPKRSTLSTRSSVDIYREFNFRNADLKTDTPENIEWGYRGVPIMAANMDGVATFEMAEALAAHGMFTCLVKHYPKYELKLWIEQIGYKIKNHWAYSLGISEADMSKFDSVYSAVPEGSIKFVCIDVANGYTEGFVEFVKRFRESYPRTVLIAGNVVTGEMTEELIISGADIVKVGIGPGSVCTTRIKTGVGYPQLSAIIECADAAHGLGGHIIADGGCTSAGDVAKAFGAGADFVMLGGMLSGHDEGGGEVSTRWYKKDWTNVDGKGVIEPKQFVTFYGMSSDTAMEKHYGSKANYRASEGRTVAVDYKGPVGPTVLDILGGVRSACTYVGASQLKHLSKCTTFIRVNNTHNKVFESKTIRA